MKKWTMLLILMLCTLMAYAHPHMFITSSVNFDVEGKTLYGAYVTWSFDRFFSADIIHGYDIDKNGIFDVKETQDIYNNAFIYTKHYHFFIFIRQDSTRSNPTEVQRFSAWQKNGILFYRFYVDLSSYALNDLYFAVYDFTFFCDFRYAKTQPVIFTDRKKPSTMHYEIIENKNYPVYYDPFDSADSTTVYYSWKPGLQTYYPHEIKLIPQ